MRVHICKCICAYPFGRLSTCVSNILSLLPPSEARPACISTAMASTTCRNRPTGVAHPCSSSSNTSNTFRHLIHHPTRLPTMTAATKQATEAQPAANPTANLPIYSNVYFPLTSLFPGLCALFPVSRLNQSNSSNTTAFSHSPVLKLPPF